MMDLPISKATLLWSRNYAVRHLGVRHPWFCQLLRIPYKVINGCSVPTPMLVRYRLVGTPIGSLNLHHFLRSDEDRDLHDHPFAFATLVLRGGYVEQTAVSPGSPYGTYRYEEHRAGAFLLRGARWAHRVDLRKADAWTLIAMTSKIREWGFHTVSGWIPFRNYHSIAGCAEGEDRKTTSTTPASTPPKTRVIVEVTGGVVDAVHANTATLDVHILDHDNFECVRDGEHDPDCTEHDEDEVANYFMLCRESRALTAVF